MKPVDRHPTVEVHFLLQLYIDDEVMRLFMCCEFETSVQLTGGDHRNFLRDMAEVGGSNYYAQW